MLYDTKFVYAVAECLYARLSVTIRCYGKTAKRRNSSTAPIIVFSQLKAITIYEFRRDRRAFDDLVSALPSSQQLIRHDKTINDVLLMLPARVRSK